MASRRAGTKTAGRTTAAKSASRGAARGDAGKEGGTAAGAATGAAAGSPPAGGDSATLSAGGARVDVRVSSTAPSGPSEPTAESERYQAIERERAAEAENRRRVEEAQRVAKEEAAANVSAATAAAGEATVVGGKKKKGKTEARKLIATHTLDLGGGRSIPPGMLKASLSDEDVKIFTSMGVLREATDAEIEAAKAAEKAKDEE